MDEGTICCYCGEEKVQVTIPNPNFSEDDFWEVCITCKKIIEQQHKLDFGCIIQDFEKKNNLNTGYPEKLIKEANDKIRELSYESGKETISITLTKT